MPPLPKKWPLVTLLSILALAAFFRFYLITEIPPGLYPDEAANGNNAIEALHADNFKIFYPENNGREGLFINLQALAIKIFGPEPWALRVVSAIIGTLTVLGIYLAATELFQGFESRIRNHGSRNAASHDSGFKIHDSTWIALLSAFFLATSYWHINFSRIGFRAILVPFFAVFGMYWLLKTIRTGKISSAIASGIAIGLGFHTYIAFRFMPLTLGLPIIFSLAQWQKSSRVASVSIGHSFDTPRKPCVPCVTALVLLAALVVALPMGIHFLKNTGDFFGRGGQVSIFAGESPLQEFLKSNILTLGMFNVWGDCNQRHNFACQPELFWPVGIFFLIGLGLAIRQVAKGPITSNLAPITLLTWFLVMMLPATLTREGLPHALRAIGMVVPAMMFAGLGAHWLWQRLTNYFDSALANPQFEAYRAQLRRIQRELIVVAVLVAVWIPLYAYRTYFYRFANAATTYGAFSVDLWHQGQYLALLPPDVKKFVVVNLSGDDIRGVPAPAQTIMFATGTFEEELRREKNLVYVKRPDEIPIPLGENTVLILMDGLNQSVRRAARQRFPELIAEMPGDFMVLKKQLR